MYIFLGTELVCLSYYGRERMAQMHNLITDFSLLLGNEVNICDESNSWIYLICKKQFCFIITAVAGPSGRAV